MDIVVADKSFADAEEAHRLKGNDMDHSRRKAAMVKNEQYLCENNRKSCFYINHEHKRVNCDKS